jgi:hypothetical protein
MRGALYLALARIVCQAQYEVTIAGSAQSDRRRRGRAVIPGVTGRKPRGSYDPYPGDWGVVRRGDLAAREGEALPFQLTRSYRTRPRSAEIGGRWLLIHGSNHTDPERAPTIGALSPGHTAGPVLQHRPSETLPRLWSEQEGLAM